MADVQCESLSRHVAAWHLRRGIWGATGSVEAPAPGERAERSRLVTVSVSHAVGARLRAFALSAVLGWSVFVAAGAGGPADGLRTEVLTIGLTKTAFLNVNRNDMEAALKTLARTIGRKHRYQVEARTQFYEEAPAFAAAVKTGAVRLAITDSWTYLAMHPESLGATPCFVSMEQKRIGKQYLVLTRRGGGVNSMADLRGKSLTGLEIVNSSLGRPWLETLLLSNRLGSVEAFFHPAQFVGKPATAVLPVFFGKSDACLVDATAFGVMAEMNPEVGKQLQIVATSEPLVDGVQLLSDAGWKGSEEVRLDLLETLRDLHLDPAGQQLLTMFKTDQLVPFATEHLDAVRRLRGVFDQSREAQP